MPLFKLSHGPWELLFSGKFQEHEVELYSNPDKILMVLVFEKKLDRIEGAIIELYKVFSATGEAEAFTETLPREVILLTKHDDKQTLKFFMLGSKPSYSRWIEEDFTKETESLLKRLETSATMIKDVSKAYELELKEIAESDKEIQVAFFTQPLLTPMLATSSHGFAESGEQIIANINKGEIVLGLTRDKHKVVEPLAFFTKTMVNEGEIKDRQKVLRVLTESALLSNVTSLIFDWTGNELQIGEAGNKSAELQKYLVEIDSLGFPVKKYTPGENLNVDLNLINPEGIAKQFGVGEKNFPRILRKIIEKGKFSSIEELAEKIANEEKSEEFTDYELLKSARIVSLMGIRYPGLFGGENPIQEITKKGNQTIARASVINLSSLDNRASLLLIHSVIKGIFEDAKSKPKKNEISSMIILAEAGKAIPSEQGDIISNDIASMMSQFPENGLGFCIGSEQPIDISPQLSSDLSAKINIVSENDVGVQLKGKKVYRVLVRPELSKN